MTADLNLNKEKDPGVEPAESGSRENLAQPGEVFDPEGILASGMVTEELPDGIKRGIFGADASLPFELSPGITVHEREIAAAELQQLKARYHLPPDLKSLRGWELVPSAELEGQPQATAVAEKELVYPKVEKRPSRPEEIPVYQPPGSPIAPENIGAITGRGVRLEEAMRTIKGRLSGTSDASAHDLAEQARRLHEAGSEELKKAA